MPRILAQDIGLRFLKSYDKTWTAKSKLGRLVGTLTGRRKPLSYHQVLEGIDLEVNPGERVGIIGPNGSGKSTLLRVISQIYKPDSGTMTVDGKLSSLLSLGTGYNNTLTGLENIRMNALLHGMTMKEIDRKLPEITEFADIGDHINKPMKYYSNGMISRLSFSIVLSLNPEILLIDEVFSVGDIAFKRKSEAALHELLNRAAIQVIVSHNLDLIANHCNRAVYIESGRCKMDGRPDEVIKRYERDYGPPEEPGPEEPTVSA
jgi:ABC-type polysaccharide/polyol phosphate transport system ATPase subunit